jgi:hypothetical protein
MRALWITVLSVAALTAAPLAGTVAASASAAHTIKPATLHREIDEGYRDEGYGATLAAAKLNALQTLRSDFGPCYMPFDYYAYGQFTDGSGWADVTADCLATN